MVNKFLKVSKQTDCANQGGSKLQSLQEAAGYSSGRDTGEVSDLASHQFAPAQTAKTRKQAAYELVA